LPPIERHQQERAEMGHPDGALGLGAGAQLLVVGREELFGDLALEDRFQPITPGVSMTSGSGWTSPSGRPGQPSRTGPSPARSSPI
jgi:hypothetical protein